MQYQQPSTQVNPALPAGTLPSSPEYAKSLVAQYGTQMKPQYQAAERDLRSNLRSSRGLADSGIEASAQTGLAQSRVAQIGDFAGALGQQQAGFNQENAVRQQLRGYQQQDMSESYRQQLELMQKAQDFKKQEQEQQQWSQMLQGVGTIAMMI